MKIFQILHISILPILSLFRLEQQRYFNSITIGPLTRNGSTIIEVDTSWRYFEFELYLTNDRYKSGVVIAQDTITKKGKYSYTYNNSYTRNTNKIFLKYRYKSGGSQTTSGSYDFNLVGGKTYQFDDESIISSTGSVGIFHSDMTFSEENITYTFEGFDDYYAPNYYQKIELSEFHIYVDEKYHKYIHANPSLVIANVDGVFDDINGSDESVIFPLQLIETENGFSFALASSYYVDPFTLLMSTNPKAGYVQTEHIFLPVNKMAVQQEFESYFALQNFGISNEYLIHHFTLSAVNNIMGDCTNSEYCVVREN